MNVENLDFQLKKTFTTENGEFETKIFEAVISNIQSLLLIRTEKLITGEIFENTSVINPGQQALGLDPTPQFNRDSETGQVIEE